MAGTKRQKKARIANLKKQKVDMAGPKGDSAPDLMWVPSPAMHWPIANDSLARFGAMQEDILGMDLSGGLASSGGMIVEDESEDEDETEVRLTAAQKGKG